MALGDIISYLEFPSNEKCSLGELYGTENFCLFIHSLIKMEQPKTVVELGTGAGATCLMAAEAMRKSGRGHIWTVDDGSDWESGNLRRHCQKARGYQDDNETQKEFMEELSKSFGLHEYLTFVPARMQNGAFFNTEEPIDVLFADGPPSNAQGCINILRHYLPRMSPHSSLFIDRASTLNHSYLLLDHCIAEFQMGRVPLNLLEGMNAELGAAALYLVSRSRFTLVHLTETAAAKRCNPPQNSRAWIRIEPRDFLPHNGVISYTQG